MTQTEIWFWYPIGTRPYCSDLTNYKIIRTSSLMSKTTEKELIEIVDALNECGLRKENVIKMCRG